MLLEGFVSNALFWAKKRKKLPEGNFFQKKGYLTVSFR